MTIYWIVGLHSILYFKLLPVIQRHVNKVTCCEICTMNTNTSITPVAHIFHDSICIITLLNVNNLTPIPKPSIIRVRRTWLSVVALYPYLPWLSQQIMSAGKCRQTCYLHGTYLLKNMRLNKIIDDSLDLQVIQPSRAMAWSQVHLIRKPTKRWRFMVNFRNLDKLYLMRAGKSQQEGDDDWADW